MTFKELEKRMLEQGIPEDADIIEALDGRSVVDMEYDKDDNSIILIFD